MLGLIVHTRDLALTKVIAVFAVYPFVKKMYKLS